MSDSSTNSDAPPASSSAPSQPDQPDQGLSFRVSGAATSTFSTLPGEHEHQQQPQSESIPQQPPTASQRKRPATSAPVVLKTNKSIVKGLVKPGAGKAGKQAKPGEQSHRLRDLIDSVLLFLPHSFLLRSVQFASNSHHTSMLCRHSKLSAIRFADVVSEVITDGPLFCIPTKPTVSDPSGW